MSSAIVFRNRNYLFPTLLNSTTILCRKDSAYRDFNDFRGRKFGWYGLQSGGGTAFYVLAKREGINILSDVDLREAPPRVIWTLLERGDVDGAIFFEPYVTQMLATGQFEMVGPSFSERWKKDTGSELEMTGIAAHESWLKSNQAAAREIVRMWKQVVQHIKSNPRAVFAKHAALMDLKTDAEIDMAAKRLPSLFVDSWDDLDKSIVEFLKIFAQDGVILKTVPPDFIAKME